MLFSIIMPVYNTEQYVKEAIESVIEQSIGFLDNVELIMIDDGSTDQSAEICLRYVKEYPNNLKYLKSTNLGPAHARNLGLAAKEKSTCFVGFLDSDDKLELTALEKLADFFQNPNFNCDLVVLPCEYFDAKQGEHKLNYRFNGGTREINILAEPEAIYFYIGGSFFRKEIFTEHSFNESLKFWEDALFINKVILAKGKYGVVAEAKYFYRKRKEPESLVDLAWQQSYRYTPHLDKGYLDIINTSLQYYGRVIPYVQFLVAYHSKLYLFPNNFKQMFSVLSEAEGEKFFQAFQKVLQHVEDDIILQQNTKEAYKEGLLAIKYKGYNNEYIRKLQGGKQMKKIITYGTYDLLHLGHVNLLRRAKALGDYLVVGLSTDEFNALKHKQSYHSYEDRKAILEAIKYVDEVIPEENWEQKISDVQKHGINTFVIGDDWEGKFDFLAEFCEVVYLPRTEGISTTMIKNELGKGK